MPKADERFEALRRQFMAQIQIAIEMVMDGTDSDESAIANEAAMDALTYFAASTTALFENLPDDIENVTIPLADEAGGFMENWCNKWRATQ